MAPERINAKRPTQKRDAQRKRVYAAGDALAKITGAKLSLEDCRDLAHRALERYGVIGGIDIGNGQGARWATSRHDGRLIVLPKWARSPVVVLHEAAHAVMDRAPGSSSSAWKNAALHGPEYVRVYVDLLRHLSPLDDTTITATFREHKVKIARGATPCPQPLAASSVRRLRAGVMVLDDAEIVADVEAAVAARRR